MLEARCPCCNRLLMRYKPGGGAYIEIRCERARCLALVGIHLSAQQCEISVVEYGRIKQVLKPIQRTPPSVSD